VISQSPEKVRTAWIVGPLIHGKGTVPGNTRSIQALEIARVIVEEKKWIKLGEGKNVWSNVHVEDLGMLIERLIEAAWPRRMDYRMRKERVFMRPEN